MTAEKRDRAAAARKGWETRRRNQASRAFRRIREAKNTPQPELLRHVPSASWVYTGETVTHTCGHSSKVRVNKYWSNAAKRERTEGLAERECSECHRRRYGPHTDEEREFLDGVQAMYERTSERDAVKMLLDPEGFFRSQGSWSEFESMDPDLADMFGTMARYFLERRRREGSAL